MIEAYKSPRRVVDVSDFAKWSTAGLAALLMRLESLGRKRRDNNILNINDAEAIAYGEDTLFSWLERRGLFSRLSRSRVDRELLRAWYRFEEPSIPGGLTGRQLEDRKEWMLEHQREYAENDYLEMEPYLDPDI